MNGDRNFRGNALARGMSRRTFLSRVGAAGIGLSGIGVMTARAQDKWQPSGPIKLIVPYPPGGGIDIVGRFISPKLQERLGQPVIV